jgi:hypothetical protein
MKGDRLDKLAAYYGCTRTQASAVLDTLAARMDITRQAALPYFVDRILPALPPPRAPRISTVSGEPCAHPVDELCVECATDEEVVASMVRHSP